MSRECLISALSDAKRTGSRLTFLDDRGAVQCRRDWGGLLESGARRAARFAMEGVRPSEVVLLLDDTGPALVEALVGLNWLGAIPVVLAPRRGRDYQRFLGSVAEQTSARRLLVGAAVEQRLGDWLAPLAHLHRPLLADAPDLPPAPRGPTLDTVWLQFSSGSTRTPRGVVVTQSCLLHNLAAIAHDAAVVAGDVLVSWLPLFHDMGIVAGLFGPPFWGVDGVLFDPSSFAYRPATWLRAISDHRGTLSVAPNFAYELCTRRILGSELEGIRLDSWRLSWSGAEMVLPSTVRRFQERFSAWGLRPNVIVPCYGAAEATLKITSRRAGEPLRTEVASRSEVARGGVRRASPGEESSEFVCVGRPVLDTHIRILDAAGRALPEGSIGEIEIEGASVCPGYLKRPDPTLGGGRWLSGDLGFLLHGELFLTGRKKELLILNGRNVYPQDVEQAAADAIPGFVRRAAAFSVPDPDNGTERVAVALELERPGSLDESARKRIALAVSSASGTSWVTIYAVPFVPITTSGKLQRVRVRESYMAAPRA